MADPVTLSVLLSIVAEKAAEEVGTRLGTVISDRIFGDNLSENQKLLKQITADIKNILITVKKIYAIVEQLPQIVEGAITDNELYKAHINIESNIQTFLVLSSWNQTVGFDALVNLINSWTLIVEKENKVDMIWEIPKYAEFLMMITRQRAIPIVMSGLDQKIDILEQRLKTLQIDQLKPKLDRALILFNTEYVNSGSFLSDIPWLKFNSNPDQTITVSGCAMFLDSWSDLEVGGEEVKVVREPPLCGKDQTYPNKPWNAQRDQVTDELNGIKSLMNSLIPEIRSVIFTLNLLKTYRAKLDATPTEKTTLALVKSEILFS